MLHVLATGSKDSAQDWDLFLWNALFHIAKQRVTAVTLAMISSGWKLAPETRNLFLFDINIFFLQLGTFSKLNLCEQACVQSQKNPFEGHHSISMLLYPIHNTLILILELVEIDHLTQPQKQTRISRVFRTFFWHGASFEAWETHRYLKNWLGIVRARGGGLLDHHMPHVIFHLFPLRRSMW